MTPISGSQSAIMTSGKFASHKAAKPDKAEKAALKAEKAAAKEAEAAAKKAEKEARKIEKQELKDAKKAMKAEEAAAKKANSAANPVLASAVAAGIDSSKKAQAAPQTDATAKSIPQEKEQPEPTMTKENTGLHKGHDKGFNPDTGLPSNIRIRVSSPRPETASTSTANPESRSVDDFMTFVSALNKTGGADEVSKIVSTYENGGDVSSYAKANYSAGIIAQATEILSSRRYA